MAADSRKRIVIKVGTGVLTEGVGKLDARKMENICAQIAYAKAKGWQPVLVSSGAVGLGMGKLGLKARPKNIAAVQKCAAVGQGILIQTWADLFAKHAITVAQILLTRDDVDNIARCHAVRELIEELLASGILPVINENDCISAAELNIKFGDNDVLSALVSSMVKADVLAIISTVSGLIDKTGTGKLVERVAKITPAIRAMAQGTTSATAVGGMTTKIKAAEIATTDGSDVYIADGKNIASDSISKIVDGINPGTLFCKSAKPMSAKKRWLAHFGRTIAKIYVDGGAAQALKERGSSLLYAGIKRLSGKFGAHDMVEIVDDTTNFVVARGLAETDSDTILAKIGRRQTKCSHKDVAVHRDNLAIV